MLMSLGWILLAGMAAGGLFRRLHLPALLGMMLVGILLGPGGLNGIDDSILKISADLRKLALIIILARAGLTLRLEDLRRVGRPAILMCFVPACFEILGCVILAPWLLGLTVLEAAILGSVIAAVSPAVVVPKMIALIEKKAGTDKGIPQLILAGASVDDVFVIVLFSVFTSLAVGKNITAMRFAEVPLSVLTGILLGYGLGTVLTVFFRHFHLRDTGKVILLLGLFLILNGAENAGQIPFPCSSLIAIMSCGTAIQKGRKAVADRLAVKFNKLWIAAEILLFVLVGAAVDLAYAARSGLPVIGLIGGALLFRMIGVAVCLVKTPLNWKERGFCMLAYTPKATVQAGLDRFLWQWGWLVGMRC